MALAEPLVIHVIFAMPGVLKAIPVYKTKIKTKTVLKKLVAQRRFSRKACNLVVGIPIASNQKLSKVHRGAPLVPIFR